MGKYVVSIWEKRMPDGVNYWVIRVKGKEGEIWLVAPQNEKYNKEYAQDAYLSIAGKDILPTPDFEKIVDWFLDAFTLLNIVKKLLGYNSPDNTPFVAKDMAGTKYYFFGKNAILLTEDGKPIEPQGTPKKSEEEKGLAGVIPTPQGPIPQGKGGVQVGGGERGGKRGATTSTEQGRTITENRTIEVSTFTKYFKPGEVGVVGGKYTVVYLKNGDKVIALVFNPTDKIKITNLGEGNVLVEGVGINGKWTKVIVNADGTVTTESGKLVTTGVYTNWEYAAGKTQVQGPATGGSINLGHDQSMTLTYNKIIYDKTKQLQPLTH
jgi:hypothetical protein